MVKVNCETKSGGAVTLNEQHGVRASYAVASAGGMEPRQILYVWINLSGGRTLQVFVNRETELFVADIVNKDGKSGTEVVRMTMK